MDNARKAGFLLSLRRAAGRTLLWLALIFLLLISVIPFYIMIVSSTHTSYEIVTGIHLDIGGALAQNYATMMSKINAWYGLSNSLIVALPYTFLTGYFGSMTAYGFAKFRFRGHGFFFGLLLCSMMLPAQLSIVGFYKLCLNLSLINTYVPLIVTGAANATTVFFLKGIIEQSIPDSLLEAGRMEGCTEPQIFHRLILPCILPGVASMCIFNFVGSWNNYLTPLILLNQNSRYTMPVMAAMIKGLYQRDYGAMYLSVSMSVVPILIVYCLFSRFIISGVTAGSVK